MIVVHDVETGTDYLVDQDDGGTVLISDTKLVIGLPAPIARSIAGVLMGMTADRAEELDHKRGLDPPITST